MYIHVLFPNLFFIKRERHKGNEALRHKVNTRQGGNGESGKILILEEEILLSNNISSLIFT